MSRTGKTVFHTEVEGSGTAWTVVVSEKEVGLLGQWLYLRKKWAGLI